MITPYHFQQEAIDKFTPKKLRSHLLGDDMGLGKTVTAIFLDKKKREQVTDGPHKLTLIVCPLTVVESWVRHLKLVYGDAARVVSIDPKNRGAFLRELKSQRADFYVIHWEGMRILAKQLATVKWFHVIADEVHRAKNRKAQQTRALKTLPALYKTGCSGTPADDKPDDLWSILNWLWPQVYRSYWKFVGHFCVYDTTINHGTGQAYRKLAGVQNASELHRQMEPWFVRRLKSEVWTELPDKYYTDIWVDLHPAQRSAYEQMKKEMIAWLDEKEESEPVVAAVVIAQLTRLQQFALAYMQLDTTSGKWVLSDPSAKLDTLMQIVDDNPGKQLVVFSQFKGILHLAARRLAAKKITHGLYTGDQSKGDRDRLVDSFQKGQTQIFLGTIAAGGEGITLTASSTEIFLDLAWKPAANRQAEDRCHRIGQKNAVQVIRLMAKDTVDYPRKQKIDWKWDTLREILGDYRRGTSKCETESAPKNSAWEIR